MTLRYNEDEDLLHITFSECSEPARYIETERGDVCRFNQKTNFLISATLLHFVERCKGGTIEVPTTVVHAH